MGKALMVNTSPTNVHLRHQLQGMVALNGILSSIFKVTQLSSFPLLLRALRTCLFSTLFILVASSIQHVAACLVFKDT